MPESRPPFRIDQIDHVVLIVEDMERAVRWYREVLGAEPEGDLMQFGMMQLRIGASMIDLVDIADTRGAWAKPETAGGRNLDHLALAISGVEGPAIKAHLAAHGVEVHEEGIRSGARGEGYSWYIRDPWGTVIELKS
jgi:glyoxylase I family protein